MLRHLIREWRDRLLRCRVRVADEQERDQWLWRIRARILEFLVERYAAVSNHPVPPTPVARALDDAGGPALGESPPRAGVLLRNLLVDVKVVNEYARWRLRSWRWW